MQTLTVLYDPRCGLCRDARRWLERQPRLVPLIFLAAGGPQARAAFPALDPQRTQRELHVVADSGEVWIGAQAFVVCLWALRNHRRLAAWLARPRHLALARPAVAHLSRARRFDGSAPDCRDLGCPV